ncbi:TPA: hypothetical protein SMF67_001106 [Serratia marcescens]|uniref:hypothetical protein n=1 Tax=Serratia marcescens TaxID=615 RepID=UPI0007455F67|nr:hypothetical protein [Serratia marcescens]MBH2953727.1 hypothetical protein [Serratia marcescens]MDP8704303.1 hypothetical protein [Serratia marcescens]CUY60110.1 Uncharacterised protein [Serratia marcescens]CUY66030.1 Uncharacterised protein [Serratia marcescens]CVA65462.1 Uncharacterised protein [Serratia marcescens]
MDVNKIFVLFALVCFCAAVYFGMREVMSLLIIIPVSLLCIAGMDKFGVIPCCIGVIAVSIATVLWVNSVTPIFGEGYASRQEAKSLEQDKNKEAVAIIISGQNAVKEKVKDPSSARFMNDFTSFHDGKGYYCGLVDAKNSFGGYTGMQRFVSNGKASGTFLQEEVNDFSSVWDRFCK